MDAAQALRELTEVSSQIEAACILDSSGAEVGSTLQDEAAAARFFDAARELISEALGVPHEPAGTPLAQMEAATLEGSVFVVIEGDLAVAAVTRPEPTVGLVFYDLKSCLRAAATPGDGDGKPRPKSKEASESAA
jgi:predicted regulator of Ras-like GTPase activity (Roadblock/LC7/MglB family)